MVVNVFVLTPINVCPYLANDFPSPNIKKKKKKKNQFLNIFIFYIILIFFYYLNKKSTAK